MFKFQAPGLETLVYLSWSGPAHSNPQICRMGDEQSPASVRIARHFCIFIYREINLSLRRAVHLQSSHKGAERAHTCPLLVGRWQSHSHLSQQRHRHPSTTISEILWVIGVFPPSSFSVPGSPPGNLLTFNGRISSTSSDLCYFFRLSLSGVTLMVLRAGYFVEPCALVLADVFLMRRLGYGFWKEDHKGEVCIHPVV